MTDQDHEPVWLNPGEQLSHPDAVPATEDPTDPEVAPGDDSYVEPYEGATRPTKVIEL